MERKYYRWLIAGAALAGAYWLIRRNWTSAAYISEAVAERLPVAKKLDTIPDVEGNYDIDGVSFDTEGVIVSSDSVKNVVAPV